MSSEESMEIIENLSEELGEKELRIMALEKEVEAIKKEKIEYYDTIQAYKNFVIDFLWARGGDWEEPEDVIHELFRSGRYDGMSEEMKYKILVQHGDDMGAPGQDCRCCIMTKEEIIEELDKVGENWDDVTAGVSREPVACTNGKYWVLISSLQGREYLISGKRHDVKKTI
jgi:hypothetical protein